MTFDRHTRRHSAFASLGAIAAALSAVPAYAEQQNACGDPVDGEVHCPVGAPLDHGIRYDVDGDIIVRLEDGLEIAPEADFGPLMVVSRVETGGAVTIDGSGASIKSRDAIGVAVEAERDIVINLESVSTQLVADDRHAIGIEAASAFGGVNISVSSVTTNGDESSGIVAQTARDGAVMINAGSVSTNGFASDGIVVRSGGLTDISVGSIEGKGDYIWGINALNGVESGGLMYSGDMSIIVDRINLSGNNNAGVIVDSLDDVIVQVSQIDIDGEGSTGVFAAGLESSRVYVDRATFTGLNSGGIVASAGYGDAVAVVRELHSEAGGGVTAITSLGHAEVQVGSVFAGGDYAGGVGALSAYGDATIQARDVTTTGVASTAIKAEAWFGDIRVNAGSVTTSGDGSYGIDALGKTNDIVVTGAVATSGDRGNGILSATTRGDNKVLLAGTVSTTGATSYGIWSVGRYGTADVQALGAISTSGIASVGIRAEGENGQVTVDAQNVSTSGAGSNGIHARTRYVEFYLGQIPGDPVDFTGNIDIRAANVSVTGEDAKGISAKGLGSANLLVGNVSSQTSEAIEVDMIGDVAIAARGDVRSEAGTAITVRGADVSFDIGASARIFGAGDAIVIDAVGSRCVLPEPDTGGANPCPNPGRDGLGGGIGVGSDGRPPAGPAIRPGSDGDFSTQADSYAADFPGFDGTAHVVNRGLVEARDGYAIRVTSGAAIVENLGQITGGIQFADGDDRFDNAGLFLLTKDSDFGSGRDLFSNTGIVRAAGSVRLAGLDRFDNAGLIDLGNGIAGDTFTLAGNYAGLTGATVRLDVDGTAGKSDRLLIEGAATGKTVIALAGKGSEAQITGAEGIALIKVGSGSDAGSFALEQTTRDIGFVRYSLAFDEKAGAFSLVGRAGAGSFRQLGALQGAADLWDASSGAWRQSSMSRRDTLLSADGEAPGRLWGTLHGGRTTRDWAIEDSDEAIALDYRQTRRGGQIGYDLLGGADDGKSFNLGVTGGYSTSKLAYRGSEERISFSTANVGLYASYANERLFANLLVKYDDHDVTLDTTAFASPEKIGGSTWGAEGEIGLRFGGKGMFIEPTAGLAWTRSKIDGVSAGTQKLAFEEASNVKARLGARFGGTTQFAGGGALTLYASGHAVKLFGDDYALTVTSGASQRIVGDRLGTYGEGRLGLSYRTSGGFEAFAEGQTEFGESYNGLGGRVGFRIGF